MAFHVSQSLFLLKSISKEIPMLGQLHPSDWCLVCRHGLGQAAVCRTLSLCWLVQIPDHVLKVFFVLSWVEICGAAMAVLDLLMLHFYTRKRKLFRVKAKTGFFQPDMNVAGLGWSSRCFFSLRGCIYAELLGMLPAAGKSYMDRGPLFPGTQEA